MNRGDELESWANAAQDVSTSLRPELANVLDDMVEAELLGAYSDEEETPLDNEEDQFSDYESELVDDYFEAQLLDAQQQWEESLDQLNKVLNWILLPLLGKFLGRRMAKTIWKNAMEYYWTGF